MNEKPIGVFDSGLGGLTAVKELRQLLPGEDIVYFGDTGRLPYGAKGKSTIVRYAKQDIAFLLSQNVKTILAACGSVSSTFEPTPADCIPVAYTGVVEAAAEAAARATRNKRVGVMGTEATVASGSYQRRLMAIDPAISTVAAACPLFVPLVEYGHTTPEDAMANLAADEYLGPIQEAEVDTVILGCTHYPLLKDMLAARLGPDVRLIDPGREAALILKATLEKDGLLSGKTVGGSIACFVSDEPGRFSHYARLFLGEEAPGGAMKVDIDAFDL